MKDAIKVENLRKVFESSKRLGWLRSEKVEVVSVRDVSFEIPMGQSVAFIGPNGAGKSTTIKMLTGILRPSGGRAEVLGLVPWEQRSRLAYHVGAVFGQRSQLWYHLPPDDTFELLSRIYSLDRAEYKKRRDMLVERFGIGPFLHSPVRKLSLGQRMKAEVAASLLHKPRLLFLDEPTIGLDVNARQQLRDLIREWNRDEGLTVFLTSHDAGDIEHVAERVIVINQGEIVLDDTVRNVRTDFLGTKILTVDFHEAPHPVPLNGVREISRDGYNLKLEVDTAKVSIESVINHVLALAPVADLTIEDPPLEQVIAHIYAAHHVQSDVESPREGAAVS
jgi:ABC-2 type transport system ATP-binding protein